MIEREIYQILRKPIYDFLRSEIGRDYAEDTISQIDNRFTSTYTPNYERRRNITSCKKIYFLENERFQTDPWLKNIRNVHNCDQETLPPTAQVDRIYVFSNLILYLPLILKYLFLTKLSVKLFRIFISKIKLYHTEVSFYENYDFKNTHIILTNFYNHLGLVKVARDCGGHVIDVQHSMIYSTHKGYDFQNWVCMDFVPDSLYLFSNFWKSQIKVKDIGLLTYKSDELLHDTSNFTYDKQSEADQGRIIIFAQKTKMRTIEKLLGNFKDKTQQVYLKLHPKQDREDYIKKYNVIDNLQIHGADKLLVFDSTVCIDLYQLGIFANVYAEVANDIPALPNLSKVTQLKMLKPVKTHWKKKDQLSLYANDTQILE